ncbi:MAG TPA: Ig-like domain-containing protein [Gemmatimonadaceae bacterium]|nr:Ig-like domain-containing protein [Gemmatimonadaceae bacterium]
MLSSVARPRAVTMCLARLFFLPVLAACGADEPVVSNVVPDNVVTQVALDPPSASITVGANLTMRATALNSSGREVVGQTFTWASSAPAIVSVTAAGVATAVAVGNATVTATTSGVSGSASINVTAAPQDTVVASVTVTPATASLPIGGSTTLGASALNAAGELISGKVFTWTTSTPAIATVSSSGVVTGVAAGSATISAATAGKSASAVISVTTAGADTVIANIVLQPASTSVVVGTTAALGAVARNLAGQILGGKTFTWSSATPNIASVSATGVVTGVAVGGPVTVTAAAEGKSATAAVTVVATPSSSGTITVNSAQQFQTMTGWEALMEIGQAECDPRAYQAYRNEVLDRAAFEVGINRIRLGLRAGFENPVDYWPMYRPGGQLTFNQWEITWFQVVNDNNDPFVINPAGFNFGYLDYTIEQLILPLRQRLQSRGEDLWVTVSYTGARSPTGVLHRDNPEEYAELVLATFQHIQQKYGFYPNSLELVNEPNIGGWPPVNIANNLLAAARRLRAAGFFPQFVGPTASGLVATTQMFDQMILVPGVKQTLNEISWHRFGTTTTADLTAIAQRAAANGMRTAMLEHGGSGHDHLHEDLTFGNVSAWQQFGLAFCGTIDSGSMYFLVSGAKVGENNPVVNIGKMTRYLRQYFRYVALRAVRLGATSGDARFAPVAFRNANGKYVVVVKASAGGSFTVGGLPAGLYGIDYTTVADYMKPLADVQITSAQSITTAIPDSGVLTIYAK